MSAAKLIKYWITACDENRNVIFNELINTGSKAEAQLIAESYVPEQFHGSICITEEESKPTGGPAFPIGDLGMHGHSGMTLRDYFAGQALQGMCSHHDTWGLRLGEMGVQAYQLADAMLAARDA